MNNSRVSGFKVFGLTALIILLLAGGVNAATPTTSTSVELYGEKTDVGLGENIILKLSAVNLITKPVMTVQVILIPPSGMSVTSTDFVVSGAGQYTTTFKLDPGSSKDIEVRIQTNQAGDFKVKGRILYYFGDNTSTTEDHTLELPIKVRETPTPTNTPTITLTPTPTPTSTVAPTATPGPTEDRFRVLPTVRLRPMTDVIERNQDGIVELYMDNPSLNDARLNVEARVNVPSGIHVYGQGFGLADASGVVMGKFEVPPGLAKTINIAIKADNSTQIGSHNIQFTGLYYPGNNKNNYQPISLAYSVNVKEASEEADKPPEATTPTSTVTPSVTHTVSPSPIVTSNLEQEVKELKERLNKTEEKQSQQESRISWLESAINSILDWLKSFLG